MKSRIEQLQDLIGEDPDDPALQYMLALEYRNTDPLKSRILFLQLLEYHPDYLPAYYTAAELLFRLEDNNLATEFIRRGISLAKMKGDHKTAAELKSLEENNLT